VADLKKKILIIEDEPTHLNIMRTKLEKNGYEVLVATNGADGLKGIKENKPDLVLLDIILPQMDGFTVLEKMKEENIKTPVVIISNSGQPVEVDRALKLGAKDYLVKAQFSPVDVIKKVEENLHKK
jgi:DNA-binding response OmpR family regulator